MGDPCWSRGDWVGRARGGYHQIQYAHNKCRGYESSTLGSTRGAGSWGENGCRKMELYLYLPELTSRRLCLGPVQKDVRKSVFGVSDRVPYQLCCTATEDG